VTDPIVVVPGSGVVPADRPLLRADDHGVLYGDGVFETLHLRPSGPWLLAEHLDRMARSAALLDLPLPPRAELAGLALEAAGAWARSPARGADEGALRLVCTRGPQGGGPTVFATASALPDAAGRQRREGIRVVTGNLGVPAWGRPPWSLSAAKSLSYAAHLAARRWAAERGADDVLWLSLDGYVLEAPTASLVWLAGDTVCAVPPDGTGILPGTTSAHLLSRAGGLGLRAEHRMITGAGLTGADAIWLASALRGLAEVTELDGAPRRRSAWTGRLLAALGYPGDRPR
jgi:4-amino-4-deoxychorismate lyase